MRCITWNIHGLKDEKRHRIVGRYLWEPRWSVSKKRRGWNGVGRGFQDRFLEVNAIGRSGGMVVAWNKETFSRVDTWTGQFSVGVKLK